MPPGPTDPFWTSELPPAFALERVDRLTSSRSGLLIGCHRSRRLADLPPLFQYSAIVSSTEWISDSPQVSEAGGGTSFTPEVARLRAIGEAFERYAAGIYRAAALHEASHTRLRESHDAVDPAEWAGRLVDDPSGLREGPIRWVIGTRLADRRPVYLPAQLVHLPYRYGPGEPVIREGTSNGLASGTSLAGAMIRGLFELVEREAFLLTYFHRHRPPAYDLDGLDWPTWTGLRRELEFARLQLTVLDLTTDLGIPVALGVLVDRTGRYPALNLGAKAAWTPFEAIRGAIEEVFHTLGWGRRLLDRDRRSAGPKRAGPDGPRTLDERHLLWADTSMLDRVDFLLEPRGDTSLREEAGSPPPDRPNHSREWVNELSGKGIETYGADLTTPDVAAHGFHVARALSPALFPLYLDETHRSLRGARLFEVPRSLGWPERQTDVAGLNPVPHPFL